MFKAVFNDIYKTLQVHIPIFVCDGISGNFCFLIFSALSVFSTMSMSYQRTMNQYSELYKAEFVLCLGVAGHCQSIQFE